VSTYPRLALLSLALLVSSGNDVLAQEEGRQQLERFANHLHSFSAKFEQRVIGTDGKVEDQSEGTVWLRQPHFIRWEYGGDFPELVVADGQHVWIYDEALEQVTVKPQSDYAADSPLSLLTDIGKLDEQFVVREAGEMEGMALLELRSKNAEAEFERVLLGLQGDELKLMTMEDTFGLRTEIRFSEPRRNQELSLELFSFTPPPDADIIGNLEPDQPGQ
jgi:outer membrane lipoprotein carrier protein